MNKHVFILFLMLITITMISITYAQTIIEDGLVSYWTFDRTNIEDGIVADTWGENDATIMGNPKVTRGILNQGLEFDGVGDYVVLPNLGNLQTRTGPSTIELWMKTSDISTYRTLFRVVDDVCVKRNRGWGLTVNATRTKDPPPVHGPVHPDFLNQEEKVIFADGYMLYEDSRKRPRQSIHCTITMSPFRHVVSDGEWHHIVFVTDALYIDEKGMEWKINNLYIDNIHFPVPLLPRPLVRFGRFTGEFKPYTQPIYLGATNTGGKAHGYFRGIIDEVRVYNRALTYDEVTNNYISRTNLAVEPTHKLPIVWGELKARQ